MGSKELAPNRRRRKDGGMRSAHSWFAKNCELPDREASRSSDANAALQRAATPPLASLMRSFPHRYQLYELAAYSAALLKRLGLIIISPFLFPRGVCALLLLLTWARA
jgi:hypothetical protein